MYGIRNMPRQIDGIIEAANAKCNHCEDKFIVVMDDAPHGFAEPCPMCEGGKLRSGEYALGVQAQQGLKGSNTSRMRNRDGRSITIPDYYHQVDTSTLSWNHGLTTAHRFACSRFGCEYPMRMANQMCGSCVQRVEQKNGVYQTMPSMREMLTIFNRADAKTNDAVERGLLIKGYLNEWKRKHKNMGVA